MTDAQWKRVLETMAKLPPPTRKDLIQKLAWVAGGFPRVFTDDATIQFAQAVLEADDQT